MAQNPATAVVAEGTSMLSPGMKTGIAIMGVFVLYLIAKNRLGYYLGLFTG
jgi:hypothetical protein